MYQPSKGTKSRYKCHGADGNDYFLRKTSIYIHGHQMHHNEILASASATITLAFIRRDSTYRPSMSDVRTDQYRLLPRAKNLTTSIIYESPAVFMRSGHRYHGKRIRACNSHKLKIFDSSKSGYALQQVVDAHLSSSIFRVLSFI